MSQKTLKIFKALSDPTRIKIVRKLIDKSEVSCQDLMKYFPLSQPTLSHHFNKLIDSGVLSVRKNGASHYYGVNKKYLADVGIDINTLISS